MRRLQVRILLSVPFKELPYNIIMTNKKESIPEEVFDYCIDNKVSIEEGLKVFIEKKLEIVETGLADLKDDVTNAIDNANMKISNKDIDDVENFLDFLNQQLQDND